MLDRVVANLAIQMAEVERKGALEEQMVVVVTSDSSTTIACHDMQSDDGVFQDIDGQEQEDGFRIHP